MFLNILIRHQLSFSCLKIKKIIIIYRFTDSPIFQFIIVRVNVLDSRFRGNDIFQFSNSPINQFTNKLIYLLNDSPIDQLANSPIKIQYTSCKVWLLRAWWIKPLHLRRQAGLSYVNYNARAFIDFWILSFYGQTQGLPLHIMHCYFLHAKIDTWYSIRFHSGSWLLNSVFWLL